MKRDIDSWGVEESIEDKVSFTAYKRYNINKALDKAKSEKKGELATCVSCSSSFIKTAHNKVFCSLSCRKKYQKFYNKNKMINSFVNRNSYYE